MVRTVTSFVQILSPSEHYMALAFAYLTILFGIVTMFVVVFYSHLLKPKHRSRYREQWIKVGLYSISSVFHAGDFHLSCTAVHCSDGTTVD